MKLNISDLASCLFWFGPLTQGLDLDTGELYDIDEEKGELVGMRHTIKFNPAEKLPRIRKLPYVSTIPIYQSYLAMVQERLGIRLGSWFDQAPVFKFVEYCKDKSMPADLYRAENEFMKTAHYKVFDFPDNDPSIPYFGDYLTEHQIQFAKEWCEKEGYEWYEE